MSCEWQSLFYNQTYNNRALTANFVDNSKFKIGKNLIENLLTLLNNKITFKMLDLEYTPTKFNAKKCLSEIIIENHILTSLYISNYHLPCTEDERKDS